MKTNIHGFGAARRKWRRLLDRLVLFFREFGRFLRPVFTVALFSSSAVYAGETFIFGDSGADTGNFHSLPGFFPGPNAPYYKGNDGLVRLSDGPMWPELLWPEMVAWTAPRIMAGPRVMNFAYGGARSDEGSFIGSDIPSLPIGLLSQVDHFEDAKRAGDYEVGKDSRAVLYAGTNDLFEAVATGGDVHAAVLAVGRNLDTAVQRLAAAGVRTIYISEIADFGHAAAFYNTGMPAQEERALRDYLNTIAEAAREQVRSTLAETNKRLSGSTRVVFLPLNELFTAVRQNPEAFGFGNMTGMIYDDANDRLLETDPSRRAGYFFVDGLHTAARAQQLEARYYAAVIDAAEGRTQSRVARLVDGALSATETLGRTVNDQTMHEPIKVSENGKWSLFAAIPVSQHHLDSMGDEQSVRIDTGAATLGLQWPGSREPRLAVCLSVFGQEGRIGGDSLRFDQQGLDFAVANAKSIGPILLSAEVGFTALSVDTSRNTGITAPSGKLKGETDGWATRGRLTASHLFHLKGWSVELDGGVLLQRVQYDGFMEAGLRGLTVSYGDIDHESFRGLVGVNTGAPGVRLWAGVLKASLSIRGYYEMADDAIAVSGSLPGSFLEPVLGTASLGERLHGQIEPSLDYLLDGGTRLSLGYRLDSDFKDYTQQMLRFIVSHRF